MYLANSVALNLARTAPEVFSKTDGSGGTLENDFKKFEDGLSWQKILNRVFWKLVVQIITNHLLELCDAVWWVQLLRVANHN